MKSRKRRRPDTRQTETPFFSKIGEQTNVEAKSQEGFFQPELTIGKPGDRFEQEADKVADAVVNRARPGPGDRAVVRKKEKVQRQAEEEEETAQAQAEEEEEAVQTQAEEEEESVQAQAEEEEEAVQTQAEEEEESVQAQAEEEEETVQAQAEEEEETVQAQAEEEEETVQAQAEEEEESVQAQAEEEEETVQAQAEEEEETVQAQAEEEEETVQTQAKSQVQRGSPAFVSKLNQQQGKGRPLPPKIRADMEAAFDSDFSAVRIHTDEEAVQLSQMLGAQAFTHGNDIFFNEGKFDPESTAGKHLLAHELTHTRQQSKK